MFEVTIVRWRQEDHAFEASIVRQRQQDHVFEASIVRSCLKTLHFYLLWSI